DRAHRTQHSLCVTASSGSSTLLSMAEPTIFQRIMAGEIPARIVHDDEQCIAFHDLDPQAPTHVLIVPRNLLPRIAEGRDEDQEVLAPLLLTARNLARQLRLGKGYRIVINNGPDGGESVPHRHVHLL